MSRKSRRKARIEAAKASPVKPIRAERDKPREFRAVGGVATIRAAEEGGDGDGKPKLPTFSMLAYTGAPMLPQGWWTPVIIDLAGVKVPSQHRPILRQHDHTRIVGHSTEIEVTDKGIAISGVLSGVGPDTREVIDLAKNGFQWQASIGANPIRTEFLEAGEETEVNNRTVTGPMTISRETELGESSFVPLGADGDTSATVTASRGVLVMFAKAALKLARQQGVKAAAKYSDEEIDKMSEDDAKAALKKCMAGDDPEKKTEAEDDPDTQAEDDPEKKTEARVSQAIAAATRKGIEAARKAVLEEERRIAEIRARITKHQVTIVEIEISAGKSGKVNLIEHAIQAGWTPDQAELVALRSARPAADVGGPLVYSTSTPEVSEAVLEAGVMHAMRHQFRLEDDSFYLEQGPDGRHVRRVPEYLQRETQREFKARYTDQVQQSAHTLFRGRLTLKQLLTLAAARAGLSREATADLGTDTGVRSFMAAWDYSTKIMAEGASTVSISNVLANVMNKFALQGYLFTEQAWREFCAIRPVNDFKPVKSINLLGDVMFKALGPTGELENASLGDQAFANQAQPFGRILTLPWVHIVNDDLSMLAGAPTKVGQGAGLALNDNIWTLWKLMAAGSVNGDDGIAFWRTTSDVTAASARAGKAYKPNKQSGAGSVFGDAGLKAGKALFDNQVDPNGNPLGFDGMVPRLLHGPSLWRDVTAQMMAPGIVYGGATAALAPNFNVWQGAMKPVMSRYVENANYVNSTTAWWLLFDPVALAVIEVCFLNGVDTPTVLQAGPDYQFDRLGISIRGTMPFGSNQQNFRGGVYSVGA